MGSLSEGVLFKLRAGKVKRETERKERDIQRDGYTEMQRGRETQTHTEETEMRKRQRQTWTEYSRQVSVCKLWRMGRAWIVRNFLYQT